MNALLCMLLYLATDDSSLRWLIARLQGVVDEQQRVRWHTCVASGTTYVVQADAPTGGGGLLAEQLDPGGPVELRFCHSYAGRLQQLGPAAVTAHLRFCLCFTAATRSFTIQKYFLYCEGVGQSCLLSFSRLVLAT